MKYLILLVVVLLSSCATTSYYQRTQYVPYQGYSYDEYEAYYGSSSTNYDYGRGVPDGYYGRDQSTQITVPNSYYAGGYRSPQSPQERDSRWVSQQNPGGYTIEISRSSKASQVAKNLMKAPKNNRTAAVRSGGGYVGVYGSYSSYQAAQKAYNNLPDDLRSNARIKSWGSIR